MRPIRLTVRLIPGGRYRGQFAVYRVHTFVGRFKSQTAAQLYCRRQWDEDVAWRRKMIEQYLEERRARPPISRSESDQLELGL